MKWFRNKEMLQDILKRNNNELQKYKNDKIVALLKDESNLIKDHLKLLDENEKLKKVISILKEHLHVKELDIDYVLDFNGLYGDHLTQQEYELIKEVLGE